jgi:hypothetical protein
MTQWLDRFPDRRPHPKMYDRRYAELGGKLFMPLIERICQQFAGVNQ